MRLFVKTESMLEAVGLVHSFPNYNVRGNPSTNVQGVLFDTDDSLCYYVYDTGNYQIDHSTVSSIGLNRIEDILSGAEFVPVSFGYAKLRRDIQMVKFEKEIDILSFLDLEKIYLTIQPKPASNPDSSLVGKVVRFEYWKNGRDPSDRVVLVKEETKDNIRGLDVLDDFKFKSFSRHKMESFKVVQ